MAKVPFPIEIALDGGIAAKKSTVQKIIIDGLNENGYKAQGFPEPLDEWNKDGIFQRFLNKEKNMAYILEHEVMLSKKRSRRSIMKEFPDTQIFVSERSIYGDKVLASCLHKTGKIDDELWNLYERWHEEEVDEFPILPSAYIHMGFPSDESFQCLVKRDRIGEDKYDRAYLDMVVNDTKERFGGKSFKDKPCYQFPTEFIVDGTKVSSPDFRNDRQMQKVIVDFVIDIVKNISSHV